jgi:hypothetical protein
VGNVGAAFFAVLLMAAVDIIVDGKSTLICADSDSVYISESAIVGNVGISAKGTSARLGRLQDGRVAMLENSAVYGLRAHAGSITLAPLCVSSGVMGVGIALYGAYSSNASVSVTGNSVVSSVDGYFLCLQTLIVDGVGVSGRLTDNATDVIAADGVSVVVRDITLQRSSINAAIAAVGVGIGGFGKDINTTVEGLRVVVLPADAYAAVVLAVLKIPPGALIGGQVLGSVLGMWRVTVVDAETSCGTGSYCIMQKASSLGGDLNGIVVDGGRALVLRESVLRACTANSLAVFWSSSPVWAVLSESAEIVGTTVHAFGMPRAASDLPDSWQSVVSPDAAAAITTLVDSPVAGCYTDTPTHTRSDTPPASRTKTAQVSATESSALSAWKTASRATIPTEPSPPHRNVSGSSMPSRSHTSDMRTGTATVIVPTPAPLPRLPPAVAEAGVIGAVGGGAVAVVGSVVGGIAGSGIARTLGVARAISRIASGRGDCHGQDPSDRPSILDSPLGIRLGDPPDYVVGIAVGAPIMCVVFAVACAVVTWLGTSAIMLCAGAAHDMVDPDCAASDTAGSAGEAALLARRRSMEAFIAGFLLGANILVTPAISAAVILWYRPDTSMAPAAAACAALVAVLVILVSLAAVLSYRVDRFRYFPAPSRVTRWRRGKAITWRRVRRWLFAADGEWATAVDAKAAVEIASLTSGSFASMGSFASQRPTDGMASAASIKELVECGLLPVVDEFRGSRAWFCLVNALVQVGLGVAGAAAEFTARDSGLVSCAATAWATCAVSAVYVLILLAARPHRYRAQWLATAVPNVTSLALSVCTAGVVQYAVIQGGLPDHDALVGLAVGAQGLAFVQAIYDLTVQAQDLVAAWRGRVLWRYLRQKTHTTAAHDCAVREIARRSSPPSAFATPPSYFHPHPPQHEMVAIPFALPTALRSSPSLVSAPATLYAIFPPLRDSQRIPSRLQIVAPADDRGGSVADAAERLRNLLL